MAVLERFFLVLVIGPYSRTTTKDEHEHDYDRVSRNKNTATFCPSFKKAPAGPAEPALIIHEETLDPGVAELLCE